MIIHHSESSLSTMKLWCLNYEHKEYPKIPNGLRLNRFIKDILKDTRFKFKLYFKNTIARVIYF